MLCFSYILKKNFNDELSKYKGTKADISILFSVKVPVLSKITLLILPDSINLDSSMH